MSAPISPAPEPIVAPTPNDAPTVVEPQTSAGTATQAPSPAPEPEQPADEGGLSREEALAALAKARKDAAKYRTQVRELEPLAQAARAAEDANKTELQRAIERAEAAESQLSTAERTAQTAQLAAKYAIPESHFRYLVGDTAEEREEAAVGIAQMLQAAQVSAPAAPPSDRPIEHLRPGASPQSPEAPSEEYPASWMPGRGN
ncbi:hypothetical protein G4X40_20195 [Rhodococcus sp. D2-41]|uniref:hypothetical protein n=1 Tax=Speluncibacter jeojiensis TaxID=2710754 RepID=UPI00240F309C|nr:hypothetical protein [Rhodococcus sp. D2-41]MDG3012464.1 hypothetical protein [Rhodococcus sp. D2-41]